MAKHLVMDRTGHSVIQFDPTKTVDIKEAMERFDKLTKEGHTAATRSAGETDYKLTKAFDPTADETLFVPQLQGG
jgi:hypothetical protein